MASRNVHTISDMKRNPKGFDIEDSDSDEEIVVSYEKERRLRSPRRFRKSNVWVPAEKRSQYGSSGNSGTFLTAFVAAIIVVVIFVLIAGSLILFPEISPSWFNFVRDITGSGDIDLLKNDTSRIVDSAVKSLRKGLKSDIALLASCSDVDRSLADLTKKVSEKIESMEGHYISSISNSESQRRGEVETSIKSLTSSLAGLTASMEELNGKALALEETGVKSKETISSLKGSLNKIANTIEKIRQENSESVEAIAEKQTALLHDLVKERERIDDIIESQFAALRDSSESQKGRIDAIASETKQFGKVLKNLKKDTTMKEESGPFSNSLVKEYPNAASVSLGAEIIRTTKDTFGRSIFDGIEAAWDAFLDRPVRIKTKNIMLEPSDNAGECWPMQGNSGNITIKLAFKTQPHFVGFAEVPLNQRASKDSSPREFCVYAEGSAELGCFEHDPTKGSPQLFNIELEDTRGYEFVKIEIRNNWGNSEYTCLYMFLVLGDKV